MQAAHALAYDAQRSRAEQLRARALTLGSALRASPRRLRVGQRAQDVALLRYIKAAVLADAADELLRTLSAPEAIFLATKDMPELLDASLEDLRSLRLKCEDVLCAPLSSGASLRVYGDDDDAPQRPAACDDDGDCKLTPARFGPGAVLFVYQMRPSLCSQCITGVVTAVNLAATAARSPAQLALSADVGEVLRAFSFMDVTPANGWARIELEADARATLRAFPPDERSRALASALPYVLGSLVLACAAPQTLLFACEAAAASSAPPPSFPLLEYFAKRVPDRRARSGARELPRADLANSALEALQRGLPRLLKAPVSARVGHGICSAVVDVMKRALPPAHDAFWRAAPSAQRELDYGAMVDAAEQLYDALVFQGNLCALDDTVEALGSLDDFVMMFSPDESRRMSNLPQGRVYCGSLANAVAEYDDVHASFEALPAAARARLPVEVAAPMTDFFFFIAVILEHEITHSLESKLHANEPLLEQLRRPHHGSAFYELLHAWTGLDPAFHRHGIGAEYLTDPAAARARLVAFLQNDFYSSAARGRDPALLGREVRRRMGAEVERLADTWLEARIAVAEGRAPAAGTTSAPPSAELTGGLRPRPRSQRLCRPRDRSKARRRASSSESTRLVKRKRSTLARPPG